MLSSSLGYLIIITKITIGKFKATKGSEERSATTVPRRKRGVQRDKSALVLFSHRSSAGLARHASNPLDSFRQAESHKVARQGDSDEHAIIRTVKFFPSSFDTCPTFFLVSFLVVSRFFGFLSGRFQVSCRLFSDSILSGNRCHLVQY